MYQPAIKDEAVRSLYRMKRAFRKPMTVILNEVLSQGFTLIDRDRICNVCQQEGNATECSECSFNRAVKRKGGNHEGAR